MKKRIFCLLVMMFAVVLNTVSVKSLSAQSAVLINASTGEVIFEHDPHEHLPMASTTKIMTALILCEEPDLTKQVVTTKEMVTVEGSSMGLLEGDTVSYYGLIVGMLLASGNDAATTTAIALSGSLPEFAERMNKKAKEIGMTETNFVTPSGLDAEGHYSTAYDMALLGAYAMKNEIFRKVASSEKLTVEYGNPPYKRTLSNHNKLLSSYDECVGVKTGYTKKSGRCLVSAAENENGFVVAVTLNDPDDWKDSKSLLERGLSSVYYSELSADAPNSIAVVGADCEKIAITAENTRISVTDQSKNGMVCSVSLPHFLYAPVTANTVIGKIDYYYGGNHVSSADIYTKADAKKAEYNPTFVEEFIKVIEVLGT